MNQEIAEAKFDARRRAKQLVEDLSNAKIKKTVLPNGTSRHPSNCVLYLREDLKIKLPTGLETFEQKKRIINVDGLPRPGDVAIIRVASGAAAPYGHVAVVRSVSPDSITIEEANWTANTLTTRTVDARTLVAAQSKLGIVGYYRPN